MHIFFYYLPSLYLHMQICVGSAYSDQVHDEKSSVVGGRTITLPPDVVVGDHPDMRMDLEDLVLNASHKRTGTCVYLCNCELQRERIQRLITGICTCTFMGYLIMFITDVHIQFL